MTVNLVENTVAIVAAFATQQKPVTDVLFIRLDFLC